jgi:hypothetical protein
MLRNGFPDSQISLAKNLFRASFLSVFFVWCKDRKMLLKGVQKFKSPFSVPIHNSFLPGFRVSGFRFEV